MFVALHMNGKFNSNRVWGEKKVRTTRSACASLTHLESSEHLGTSGSALNANIKVRLEGASALAGLNVVVLAGHLKPAAASRCGSKVFVSHFRNFCPCFTLINAQRYLYITSDHPGNLLIRNG